jgi:hypothetical protein
LRLQRKLRKLSTPSSPSDVSTLLVISGTPLTLAGYYVTIPDLKKWPMKKLSSIIGDLWEGDVYKAYWSLMAKAWSVIRDQIGKDQAPLDQFLIIICGHLSVPGPESYLMICGWTLSLNEEGDPMVSRDGSSEFACMSTGVMDIALSVEDIIAYVQSMGYATTFVATGNTTSSTFLGRSINSSMDKGGLALGATATVAPLIDRRLVARNKRRTRRDVARTSSLRVNIEKDIINAHRIDSQLRGLPIYEHYPTPAPVVYESNPFYEQLVDYLDSPVTDLQEGADIYTDATPIDDASVSDGMSFGEKDDFASNVEFFAADFEAFRPGANEDATLPAFNDVPNA